jgi:dihydroxy-acid dehydratase
MPSTGASAFSRRTSTKPQIGIGTPLLDGNLCNVHAHELAQLIKQGCAEAGLIGFPFRRLAGERQHHPGHEGGAASLCSRNLMANGAEMVCTSHCYDGMIGLHHCDKNGPAFAMALARMNYPGLIVNGGSILPGCHKGAPTTILDVYDAAAKAKQRHHEL